MARQSAHDHLKPAILALFAEGKLPAEVCKIYLGIPRPTIYRWHEESEKKKTDKIRTSADNPVDTGSHLPDARPKLTVLPPLEDEGIGWGIRKLKDIIELTEKRDPRAAISAIVAYFKGMELLRNQPTTSADSEPDEQYKRLEELLDAMDAKEANSG